GDSGPRRVERRRGEEVRARFPSVVEREATPDWAGRGSRTRDDRLRSHRVAFRLPPERLVVAKPLPELGHLGPSRYAVARFPGVGVLELLPGEGLAHGETV